MISFDDIKDAYNVYFWKLSGEFMLRYVPDIIINKNSVDHPDTATTMDNLNSLLKCPNNHYDAASMYQKALAIFERAHCPVHISTSLVINNLALCIYRRRGTISQKQCSTELLLLLKISMGMSIKVQRSHCLT